MRSGGLAYDATPILSGAALVLGFVLLHQRRARGCVTACALQGWAVALAAAWQGWARTEPQCIVVAVVTLAANGVVLPWALTRFSGRPGLPGEGKPALGAAASMLLGVLLVVVAGLAVRSAIPGGELTRESLAVALSVMLLGLATMIVWRGALLQVAGVLSVGNGVILGALGVLGMPMAAALAVAAVALGAFAVAGLSVRVRGRHG